MQHDNRMKLAAVPVLASLRRLVEALRDVPLPKPLQRLTERGLERLRARIPELATLLDASQRAVPRASEPKPRPSPGSIPPGPGKLADAITQLSANDYRLRLRAVQALVHHREQAASDALCGALRDRSVEVAVASVSSLQIVAGRKARATLLEVMDNDQDYYHPLVRAAAVHALGGLLSEHECAPLVRALRDHDAEVSIAAISALGACAPSRAGELLLEVVENRDGFFLPITRLAAARGLERLSWLPITSLERVSGAEQDPQLSEILARVAERQRA
jgi:HEAT repeat protein